VKARALSFLAACAACAACGGAAPAGTTSGTGPRAEAAPTATHFAWTAPLRAHVVEQTERDGDRAVMHYDVVVAPSANDTLRVGYASFGFDSLNGQSATSPDLRDATTKLAQAFALQQPAFIVSRTGHLVDVDLDIKRMEEGLRATGVFTAEEAADAEKLLETPVMQSQVKAKAGETWNVWAGSWLPYESGTPSPKVLVVPVFGTRVESPVRFDPIAPVPGRPGHVRLRATSSVRGDAMRDAILRYLDALAKQKGEPPIPEGEITSVTRDMRLEVETDAATMRPDVATSESTMEIAGRKGTRRKHELHVYRFTWVAP